MFGVIVACDFIVQVGQDHMGSTALSQGLISAVAANGIIAINNAFALTIETSDEVKCVVGKESSAIKSFGY